MSFAWLNFNRGHRSVLAAFPAGLLLFASSIATAQTGDGVERARLAEQRRIAVIEQAVDACISVFSADGQGGGSGVVVTPDGYALTNYHVVDPCGSYMHCSMPDGRLYDAVLVGIDPVGDVAMIKLLGRDDFPVARLGNSDNVRVGDYCFAVGNPFLLAGNFQPSVSWGIVSGTHRYQYPAGTLLEYADCIQTDAAINPGNSGGPLFNGQGELIGINGRGSFEKRGRVNVGVGYAISINQIKFFWSHLSSGRIVDHATLGAIVAADHTNRIRVQEILSTSDAWRRGLRRGDEIVSLGGRNVNSVNEFKNVLGIYPAGWQVPLVFQRDGESSTIFVRLDSLHSPQQLASIVRFKRKNAKQERERDKPIPESRKTDDWPDTVKALVENREGYANWHFNRVAREEIRAGFRQTVGVIPLPGKLQLTGQLNDGTPLQCALDLDKSGIRWGDQARVLDPGLDLALQLEPEGSGGLLPALHLWYRFLQLGPEELGDVYYLGHLPDRTGNQFDVLVCNTDGVQIRFLFDLETRQLSGMEFRAATDQDPCEIRFHEFRQVGDAGLPHRISVVCGDSFRQEIQFDTITADPVP